jgi:hypothetical protein
MKFCPVITKLFHSNRQTDRQAQKHDKANSHFLQFCGYALKKLSNHQNTCKCSLPFIYYTMTHISPLFNTLRTGDADLLLYAYKQFKYPVSNVLTLMLTIPCQYITINCYSYSFAQLTHQIKYQIWGFTVQQVVTAVHTITFIKMSRADYIYGMAITVPFRMQVMVFV